MSSEIIRLEYLYAKVKEGTATLDEYCDYILLLGKSCIKKDELLLRLEKNYNKKPQK